MVLDEIKKKLKESHLLSDMSHSHSVVDLNLDWHEIILFYNFHKTSSGTRLVPTGGGVHANQLHSTTSKTGEANSEI